MNKVILIGRLTRDPDVRWTTRQDGTSSAVSRYTLAVDRRIKAAEGQQSADFISCVAFGKAAEFAEKYLQQGTKIAVSGHIQTGSYTNRQGQKVYTTDVIIEEQEFAESKASQEARGGNREGAAAPGAEAPQQDAEEGFMQIPEGYEDEGLPFN